MDATLDSRPPCITALLVRCLCPLACLSPRASGRQAQRTRPAPRTGGDPPAIRHISRTRPASAFSCLAAAAHTQHLAFAALCTDTPAVWTARLPAARCLLPSNWLLLPTAAHRWPLLLLARPPARTNCSSVSAGLSAAAAAALLPPCSFCLGRSLFPRERAGASTTTPT